MCAELIVEIQGNNMSKLTENDIRRIVREELERSKKTNVEEPTSGLANEWTLTPNNTIEVRSLTLGMFDGFISPEDANSVEKELLSGKTFTAEWGDKRMIIIPTEVAISEEWRPYMERRSVVFVWFDIV